MAIKVENLISPKKKDDLEKYNRPSLVERIPIKKNWAAIMIMKYSDYERWFF